MKTTLYYSFVLISLSLFGCESKDYKSCFQEEWNDAEQYVQMNRDEWSSIFSRFAVPDDIAIAVIFPELIRYSSLQDYMETAAVKGLYVKGGSRMADFSIGRFQMKPSFAQEVEKWWMKSGLASDYGLYFDVKDNIDSRRERVLRLDDMQWQCVYLSVFLKLIYMKFENLSSENIENQVKICATAYNYSFSEDYDALCRRADLESFHIDYLPSADTEYYSYSDISFYFYNFINKLTN
jgi:hypothetical protein